MDPNQQLRSTFINLPDSHFVNPIKFTDFSLVCQDFSLIFSYFSPRHFSQKNIYLFFLNAALVTSVYANIPSLSAIS